MAADVNREMLGALRASNEWIPEDTPLHAANAAAISNAEWALRIAGKCCDRGPPFCAGCPELCMEE